MADTNTDITVNKLIVNRVTKSIYDRLKSEGKISDSELYTFTDLSVILDGILDEIQDIKDAEDSKADTSLSNIDAKGLEKIRSYSLDVSYKDDDETLIISKS